MWNNAAIGQSRVFVKTRSQTHLMFAGLGFARHASKRSSNESIDTLAMAEALSLMA